MGHNSKAMNKRVLLIGRNPTVLVQLAAALATEGFAVTTTNHVDLASQEFNAMEFDLIAFGRGVDEKTNAELKADFLAQNKAILLVDGLAPVIPLLAKQIQLALAVRQPTEKMITHISAQVDDRLTIQVSLAAACQLTIDLYQLDAVHHTHQERLVTVFADQGSHSFSVDRTPAGSTIDFLVAEAVDRELAVLPLR